MRRKLTVSACTLVPLLACSRAPSSTARDRTVVVVSNEDSGDLTFLDGTTDAVLGSVRVGKRPRGLRASPDGKRIFVALSGSPKSGPEAKEKEGERNDADDGIGVVDLETRTLLRVIASGRDPESFDLTPDGSTLYVSNEETAEVSVVDVESGKVERRIAVGREPEGVTMAPDGAEVFVTSESDDRVDVIDTRGGRVVRSFPTGARPRAIALGGGRGYVTAEQDGSLDLIDTKNGLRTGRIRTGGATARPMAVVLSADGRYAYVSNGREGSVAIVDVGTRAVVHVVDGVGRRPWGIALDPGGTKLYVAAGPDLAVVDVTRAEVTRRVPVGAGPWGVVVVRSPKP